MHLAGRWELYSVRPSGMPSIRDPQLDVAGNRQRLSTVEQHQLTFFVAAFSMLAKLAQTDGRVTREEIDSIEGFMEKDLRLDPQSRMRP